jgi:hypothetical protein
LAVVVVVVVVAAAAAVAVVVDYDDDVVVVDDEVVVVVVVANSVRFDVSENLSHSMGRMLGTLLVHFFKVWRRLYPDCPIAMDDFLVLTSSSPKKGIC